jgi:hypothetical protein
MSTAQPIDHLLEKIRHLPAERVAEVEDFVDFLNERARRQPPTIEQSADFDFPVISVGQWPQGLIIDREEMYGDDGR